MAADPSRAFRSRASSRGKLRDSPPRRLIVIRLHWDRAAKVGGSVASVRTDEDGGRLPAGGAGGGVASACLDADVSAPLGVVPGGESGKTRRATVLDGGTGAGVGGSGFPAR